MPSLAPPPLLDAVKASDVATVERLLADHPAHADAVDANDTPLLVIATFLATAGGAIPTVRGTEESRQVFRALLEAGANPDAADASGATALHDAARCGHPDLIRQLRQAGASVEGHLLGTEGGSPLALALFYAGAELAPLLQPTTPDNLRHAAAMGQALGRFLTADGELAPQALVGLDFYRPTDNFPVWERTYARQEVLDESLSWAARNGQLGAMEELTQLGAQVDSQAYRGTPLLWAVYANHRAAATWLLDHGADPNLRHDFGGAQHGIGAVALHLAAQFGAVDCIDLLLSRGADPDIADAGYDGTPVEWAEHAGQAAAAERLRRR